MKVHTVHMLILLNIQRYYLHGFTYII